MVFIFFAICAFFFIRWVTGSGSKRRLEDRMNDLEVQIAKLRQELWAKGVIGKKKEAEAPQARPAETYKPAPPPAPKVAEAPKLQPVKLPPPPSLAAKRVYAPPTIPIRPQPKKHAGKPATPLLDVLEKRWNAFVSGVDWELFTGAKLFAWLGGLALFLAAGFFVKYSIDKNLIAPEIRLAIAAVIGALLVAASFKFEKGRFDIMRETLGAGGLGVLYSVVFAATLYYHFLDELPGFGLLLLISASAFVLAVYHQGLSIAMLGALGAYLTPVLVNTGQNNLAMLFLYLAVVNIGLFEVARRLRSSPLGLWMTLGTVLTLGYETLAASPAAPAPMIAAVWSANLALFSAFADKHGTGVDPDENAAFRASGLMLFIAQLAICGYLLTRPGASSLALLTAGVGSAVALGSRHDGWVRWVIPHSMISLCLALAWSIFRFDASAESPGLVMLLVYGVFGSLAPVVLLAKKRSRDDVTAWLKGFPLMAAAMALLGLVRAPDATPWFWAVELGIQGAGLLAALLAGGLLSTLFLVILMLISGLVWICNLPADVLGISFLMALLGTGFVFSMLLVVLIKYSGTWIKRLDLGLEHRLGTGALAEWLPAAPALGAFVMLGTAFALQPSLPAHAAMATLLALLVLALTLCRRADVEALGVVALLAALPVELSWYYFGAGAEHSWQVLCWSLPLWLAAAWLPFAAFHGARKWSRVWMAFSLFEAGQALLAIKVSGLLWESELAGWLPLALAFIKVPAVALLLRELDGKPERESVIAFHGGVLLFYVTCLPVLLLSHGWMGLSLVLESSALLWLHKRVQHQGLRWTALVMAPAGLLYLYMNLEALRAGSTLPLLNPAFLSVAGATASLFISAWLAGLDESELGGMDLRKAFLWMAVACGFYLINLGIADFFSTPGKPLSYASDGVALKFILYSLSWAALGALLWKAQSLPRLLRFLGLLLLGVACLRSIFMPWLQGTWVPGLAPLLNLSLLAYLPLLALLWYLVHTQDDKGHGAAAKAFMRALLLLMIALCVKVELSTVFHPGAQLALVFGHNPAMSMASGAGWLLYGVALLVWPREMEQGFRTAGLLLFLAGMAKLLLHPLSYPTQFGALSPVLNLPSLLFLLVLGLQLWFSRREWRHAWGLEGVEPGVFWGALLGFTGFYVLNVEVAHVFGSENGAFSLMTNGKLAHQLADTVAWLLYAVGLLVTGLKTRQVSVRWASLLLLVVSTLKVFLRDLWSLGQLYRVGSFVGLAVVLMLVSFLYQRFLSGASDEK